MELGPVERITAGAIGEPGQRTFYLQARSAEQLVTVIVEKQQVELLAASIVDILERVGKETEEGPGGSEMELEEPLEPRWRVGKLSIGYAEDQDAMVLELEELVPEQEDEEAAERVGMRAPDRIRLWASRPQMLALSRHGAAVAAKGRPRCRFCDNPIDPGGHACPAMNGHRGPTTV